MKGIIDRFEGEFAVVELDNREMKNIKKEILPEGIKEGTAIKFVNGEWQIDQERTENLKSEIDDLAKNLFE
ncbi:MAG: DUF3006 domain-containing protein [Peptococcaceae bacterium]|jgi:hypothetical protein|nr:DUF3006 domain-containing protein [Peptococcaceae bacterium]